MKHLGKKTLAWISLAIYFSLFSSAALAGWPWEKKNGDKDRTDDKDSTQVPKYTSRYNIWTELKIGTQEEPTDEELEDGSYNPGNAQNYFNERQDDDRN